LSIDRSKLKYEITTGMAENTAMPVVLEGLIFIDFKENLVELLLICWVFG
jgi:hypothetical protein